jgi:hypothetical protein
MLSASWWDVPVAALRARGVYRRGVEPSAYTASWWDVPVATCVVACARRPLWVAAGGVPHLQLHLLPCSWKRPTREV